jgi:hypothetical protein
MTPKNISFALCLLLGLIVGHTGLAQDNLPETEKAIGCIDLRLDKLRDSEMAQKLNLQDAINEMIESEGGDIPIDPNKITRIFGAVSLPQNIQSGMEMSPFEPLPFNFFVELQFADEAAADAMAESVQGDGTIEFNGKTYEELDPPNVWAHRKSPTSFLLGTKDFVTREYRDLFAANLRNIWSNSNDAPIRAAVDMTTRVDFLREIIAMAKAEAPPMFAPMIDVIDNAESLSLAIDLDIEDFVDLRAKGIDESNAEELRGVVDGLLGMGKMMAGEGIAEMRREVPKMADIAQEVMDDLKTSGEGREVNIILKKPEGMEEMIAEAIVSTRAAAKEISKLNEIRQVCLAMHNHADAYKKFPFEPNGNPRIHESLSWRVHLLPFLEENNLYESLALAEEVGSAANAEFAAKMPKLFGSDNATTTIVGIKHDEYPEDFTDIPDGTSGTIVMIEYPAGKPWMERNDLTIDEAVELFASLEEGEKLAVAFYDGSVRFLKADIPEDFLRNLLDPKDGNVVDWEKLSLYSGR